MENWGLKVSSEFRNALRETDPRNFRLWSKYKDFMITKRGIDTLTIPNGAGSATKTIPHGLGYPPAYFMWVDLDNNGRFWMVNCKVSGGLSSFTNHYSEDPQSDRTNISFLGDRDGTSGDEYMPFSYVLFSEPGIDPAGGNDKPIGYTKSDYGLKVSIPGVNVLDSKLYQQIVNSNCDMLKYHSTVIGSMTWDNTANGENSKDIVHGLGYTPMFLAWGKFPNSGSFEKYYFLPLGRTPQPFASGAFADNYKITVEIVWSGSPSPTTGTFDYRVIIFENPMIN